MLKCSERSRRFLQEHIQEVLTVDNLGQALDAVYDWIDANGFGVNGLYNAEGKDAQAVYDDLFASN